MDQPQYTTRNVATGQAAARPVPDTSFPPPSGVGGWLWLFIILNMYFAPVLVALATVAILINLIPLARAHPVRTLFLVTEAVGTVLLRVRWILIACRLRDLKPRVVQETKTWLRITGGWIFVGATLLFLAGKHPKSITDGFVRDMVLSLVVIGIWYLYFSVSKRVRATYPDWDE